VLGDLSLFDFLNWMRENYRHYLRSETSVEYDMRMWFDSELGLGERR
jgi:hypothetical protein